MLQLHTNEMQTRQHRQETITSSSIPTRKYFWLLLCVCACCCRCWCVASASQKYFSNSNCLCCVESFVRFGNMTTGRDVDNDENDREKKEPRENKIAEKKRNGRILKQRPSTRRWLCDDCCVGNISSIDNGGNRRTNDGERGEKEECDWFTSSNNRQPDRGGERQCIIFSQCQYSSTHYYHSVSHTDWGSHSPNTPSTPYVDLATS